MKKLLFISFLSVSFMGFGQTPELIKDINAESYNGVYKNFAKLNNTLYFTLDDTVHGSELWKSDGTTAGTVMVKDIYVGKNSGVNGNIVALNNKVYFNATDGIHGSELWQSDGTPNGTSMVKDIMGNVGDSQDLNPANLGVVNGVLYFVSETVTNYNAITGRELWRSDGTDAGTYMLKDINPGPQNSNPANLTDVNGALFFTANGDQIWKSDGTEAGTVLVKDIDINSNSNSIKDLTSANGLLFFTQNNYGQGGKLWKSDGTAISTVALMSSNSQFRVKNLRNLDNTLVFSGYDGDDRLINPNCHAWQPWKSDGTDIGTVLIKDIFTYQIPNTNKVSGSSPEGLTIVGNTLYFTANDGTLGNKLLKSDGTTAGTVVVKTLPNTGIGQFPISNYTDVNGTLFFLYNDNITGAEIWKSDGTNAGTTLIKDINVGGGGAIELNGSSSRFLAINTTLFFVATDNITGYELWKSDGTNAGTVLVKDNVQGSPDGNPSYLTDLNGTLYFSAVNMIVPGSASQTGLWKSDGTNAGTTEVSHGDAFNITNVNNTLFFGRFNETLTGPSLWKSDGTSAGTVEVKNDVKVLVNNSTNANPFFFNFNGTLFFVGDDSEGENQNPTGYELWKSDGTNAGTALVKEINPGVEGGFSNSPNFFAINGFLYFIAYTNDTGIEIWKTDGTTAGTSLLKDIYTGVGSSVTNDNPYFTNVGGTLYFLANDGTNNRQLWKTDGTTTGTVMITNPTNHGYSYNSLINVNGTLFLGEAFDGNLWKSDGTTSGTVLVKNGFNAASLYFTNVNNTLFFFGNTGDYGRELWKSDGTALGTVLVKDIYTGGNSSVDENSTPISYNNKLYFSAKNATNGYEPWESDGTETGTVAYDIFASDNSSFPKDFTPVNGTCFFTAVNEKGRELWKLSPCTTNPGLATASDATIAVATTATLYATCPTENTVVKWYNQASRGSLLTTGSTFTTPLLYDNTTYYVACESGACVSGRTSVLVTVTVLPPAQPANFTTSTNAVCQGVTEIVYTVPNVNGVTYSWSYSGTGAIINGTGNSVTVDFTNNATSGTLSVTATNSAGTSAARTLAITVTASPSAPMASGVTISAENTASITATGCSVYKWYDLSTGGSLLFTGNPFVSPVLTTNTTYHVACSDASCPETSRTSVVVTVNGVGVPPQPGPISGGNAACQGRTTLNYSVTAVSGATSYTWTYSGTGVTFVGGVNNTRSVTVDFSYSATSGTMSVTANNANGSSPASTMIITISNAPPAPMASGVTIASGNTASLTATGCSIYKWYNQATGGAVAFTGQNFTTPALGATANYYVACNPGTSCESPRVPVTINIPCVSTLSISTNYVAGNDLIAKASATTGVIIATNQVTNTAKITYQSKAILLDAGFKAQPSAGGYFTAETGGCN